MPPQASIFIACVPVLSEREMLRTIIFCCAILVPSFAHAAFDASGLETFSGATVDSNTWRMIHPEHLSQNNAAIFTCAASPGEPTHLVSIAGIALGVGGTAQVQLNASARTSETNFSRAAWIVLTTDNSGVGFLQDSYAVATELSYGTPSFTGNYYASGAGTGNGSVFTPSLNHEYGLRIGRLTSTSIRHTLLDTNNSILRQLTRTVPANTDLLQIAIAATSIDATFDNVQLSGNYIPEPASAIVILSAAALLRAPRRPRCSVSI
jgi:hypothetical protein